MCTTGTITLATEMCTTGTIVLATEMCTTGTITLATEMCTTGTLNTRTEAHRIQLTAKTFLERQKAIQTTASSKYLSLKHNKGLQREKQNIVHVPFAD
jgi:hypothetical protein